MRITHRKDVFAAYPPLHCSRCDHGHEQQTQTTDWEVCTLVYKKQTPSYVEADTQCLSMGLTE